MANKLLLGRRILTQLAYLAVAAWGWWRGEREGPWGLMWASAGFLIKSIKGRGGPTCRARGFQRMFFSMAGVELSVPWGRFFRVRDTTPLSARSEPTRLRNCQPTCRRENVLLNIIIILWMQSSTKAALPFSWRRLNCVRVVIGSGLLRLSCGGGDSIYRAFM